MDGTIHAFLMEGEVKNLPLVYDFLAKENEANVGSPDYYERTYDTLGVDEARELSTRTMTKPVETKRKVFVIVATVITTEAQNALLKTFEEPQAAVLLILITPRAEALLPTLRSRVVALRLTARKVIADSSKRFLSLSTDARMEFIKQLVGKDADERSMADIHGFLTDLELLMVEKSPRLEVREGLLSVYRAKKYIADKGSLVKTLLEQVALLVPKF